MGSAVFPPLVMGLGYGALGDDTLEFLLNAATAATAAVFTATRMAATRGFRSWSAAWTRKVGVDVREC